MPSTLCSKLSKTLKKNIYMAICCLRWDGGCNQCFEPFLWWMVQGLLLMIWFPSCYKTILTCTAGILTLNCISITNKATQSSFKGQHPAYTNHSSIISAHTYMLRLNWVTEILSSKLFKYQSMTTKNCIDETTSKTFLPKWYC